MEGEPASFTVNNSDPVNFTGKRSVKRRLLFYSSRALCGVVYAHSSLGPVSAD